MWRSFSEGVSFFKVDICSLSYSLKISVGAACIQVRSVVQKIWQLFSDSSYQLWYASDLRRLNLKNRYYSDDIWDTHPTAVSKHLSEHRTGKEMHLCNLCEGGLWVSGQKQLIRLFQIGHLHVNIKPGDGSLRTQAPLQLLQQTKQTCR